MREDRPRPKAAALAEDQGRAPTGVAPRARARRRARHARAQRRRDPLLPGAARSHAADRRSKPPLLHAGSRAWLTPQSWPAAILEDWDRHALATRRVLLDRLNVDVRAPGVLQLVRGRGAEAGRRPTEPPTRPRASRSAACPTRKLAGAASRCGLDPGHHAGRGPKPAVVERYERASHSRLTQSTAATSLCGTSSDLPRPQWQGSKGRPRPDRRHWPAEGRPAHRDPRPQPRSCARWPSASLWRREAG